MPARQTLALTRDQRAELVALRDHGPLPYQREQAAALLKIADGAVAAHVARSGLHRRRQPETVYRWLRRYRAAGVAGLRVAAGRGRKPAFFPSDAGRGAHRTPALAAS